MKACRKVQVQSVCRLVASVDLRIVDLNGIGFNTLNTIFSVAGRYVLVKRKNTSNEREILKKEI